MNTSSNWTGRVHRSLNSAFGPHTSQRIEDDAEPYSAGDLAIAVIAVLSLAGIFVGVI